MNKLKKICKVCATTITPIQRPGIGCCTCTAFYHFSCANLQEEDIKYIEQNPVGWFCPKCNKPQKKNSIIPGTPRREDTNNPSTSSTSQRTEPRINKKIKSGGSETRIINLEVVRACLPKD
jgi:hypothetical protein